MKTARFNRGSFAVVYREIRVRLKHGEATLRCSVQKGTLPSGKPYRMRPRWWIQLDGSPCASGPWTPEAIRRLHAAH